QLKDPEQVSDHLISAFELHCQPIVLNKDSVEKTRQGLQNLPDTLLAYVILNSYPQSQSFDPSLDQDVTASIHIPNLYTAKNFDWVINTGISNAISDMTRENWVLGNYVRVISDKSGIDRTYREIKQLYLSDYVNWWKLAINNCTPQMFTSLQQAIATLNNFSSPDSMTQVILKTVLQNTDASLISESNKDDFKNNISTKFISVDQLLDGMNQAQLRSAITELQTNLTKISNSSNQANAAFVFAKAITENPEQEDPIKQVLQQAQQVSPLLQDWLQKLAMNSLAVVLREAHDYINQQWNDAVLVQYNAKIKSRYPIDKTANQDIELDDFTAFFSPDGILDNFFRNYLSPFVDTRQANWQAIKLYGLDLFSENTLHQFERAAIIQKMFFPDHSNKLSVVFALQQLLIGPAIQNISLDMNNQSFSDTPDQTKLNKLIWPGSEKNATTTLLFTDTQGQQYKSEGSGPWGLFKLIDTAKIKTLDDTQHFLLTFDLDGNAAKYELIAKNPINPFIPGVVDQFSAPENL
ncbi:MAG: ImcF-related family protein, partial [Nitrososphaerales archaeon]